MTTPYEQWKEWFDATSPKDAPLIQQVECQRAFYAGMFSMLQHMIQIAALDEDDAVELVEAYEHEIKTFFYGMPNRPYEVYKP